MRLLRWCKKEFFHILPVFLFFLVFFTLINWTEAYLFEKMGVTPFGFLEVAIAAALIAKVILVVDHLTITHVFKKKPLAYVILWKTLLYWIILLIVRLLIRFAPIFFWSKETLAWDFSQLFHEINWNLFISIHVYYLMLLFIFVTFQELAFKIGTAKMRQLFFGK